MDIETQNSNRVAKNYYLPRCTMYFYEVWWSSLSYKPLVFQVYVWISTLRFILNKIEVAIASIFLKWMVNKGFFEQESLRKLFLPLLKQKAKSWICGREVSENEWVEVCTSKPGHHSYPKKYYRDEKHKNWKSAGIRIVLYLREDNELSSII